MKRIGILTSGGDAPGMNAAVRAAVRSASYYDMSVVGFKRGYNGLLMRSQDAADDYSILTNRSVSDKVHKGGTFLMTARCKDFRDPKCQLQAVENMRSLGIEGLIVVGGDGTFAGGRELCALGFPVVGIPGTIDNDLAYTDFTLGFDTAVNTACECINRIRETSESHERASLIEVMGRNCGDIAVHTALACGAEFVIVPEAKWSVEEVAGRMKWSRLQGKKSNILIFAEGAFSSLTSDLNAICRENESLKRLDNDTPTAAMLAAILEGLSGQETRATVLGYIQRGGSPSAFDRTFGSRMGARAVELLRDDVGGRVLGIHGNQIIDEPIEASQENHRPLNEDFIHLIEMMSQ